MLFLETDLPPQRINGLGTHTNRPNIRHVVWNLNAGRETVHRTQGYVQSKQRPERDRLCLLRDGACNMLNRPDCDCASRFNPASTGAAPDGQRKLDHLRSIKGSPCASCAASIVTSLLWLMGSASARTGRHGAPPSMTCCPFSKPAQKDCSLTIEPRTCSSVRRHNKAANPLSAKARGLWNP